MKNYIALWQNIINQKIREEPVKSRLVDTKPTADKPEVFYVGQPRFDITDGNWVTATVYGLNHYYIRVGIIHTSPVICLHADGSFETFNTLYKPSVSPDGEDDKAELYEEESMTA